MTKTIKFTDKYLKNGPDNENYSRENQIELYDTVERGLSVRFSPRGTTTFYLLYRFASRPRRFTLGRYPDLSLAEARRQARAHRADLQKGVDPANARTLRKLNHEKTLFSSLVRKYIVEYAQKRNKTWKQTEGFLERGFMARWGKLPIDQLTKVEMREALKDITEKSPSVGRASAAALRKFLNWTVEQEYLPVTPFPTNAVNCKLESRERCLSEKELIQLWKAAEKTSFPFGPLVQLLILTGQRLGEWAHAEWSEIDLEKGLWTIPKEKNKSGRTHVVPLGPNARRILDGLSRREGKFVFPARSGEGSISGFSKWKIKIDATSNVSDWRLHDIRRTVATGLSREAQVPNEIIGRILNHAFGGVIATYNRYDFLEQKRKALLDWDAYLERTLKKN